MQAVRAANKLSLDEIQALEKMKRNCLQRSKNGRRAHGEELGVGAKRKELKIDR